MGAFSPSLRSLPGRRFFIVRHQYHLCSTPFPNRCGCSSRGLPSSSPACFGGALYALGAGSVLVVPLAAVAAVVLGEVYFLFADGDGPV